MKAKVSKGDDWCSNRATAVFAVVAFTLVGCNQPTNYNDCVLKYVKAGMDSAAVQTLTRSCRDKFPKGVASVNTPASRLLTIAERERLTGRAGLAYGSQFSGDIYNGNVNISVTELEITITTKLDGSTSTRTYSANLSIPPQTAAGFRFTIIPGDKGADHNWFILSAKGLPTN